MFPVKIIHPRAGISMRRNCYLFASSYRGNTAWLPAALPSRLQSFADSRGRLAGCPWGIVKLFIPVRADFDTFVFGVWTDATRREEHVSPHWTTWAPVLVLSTYCMAGEYGGIGRWWLVRAVVGSVVACSTSSVDVFFVDFLFCSSSSICIVAHLAVFGSSNYTYLQYFVCFGFWFVQLK